MGKSVKELLAEAKVPETFVEVCLRGDLVAEIEELKAEFVNLREDEADTERSNRRMVESPRRIEINEEIEQLRAQMADATIRLRLRKIDGSRWREMKLEYPAESPEVDNPAAMTLDQRLGVDLYEIAPAIVPRQCVEPDMDDDDWEKLWKVIADGDRNRLAQHAYALQEQGVDIPKSLPASLVRQRRERD